MSDPSIYQQATYLKSAPDLTQMPPDTGQEVAFIGRSNAGKSSALNVITGIKGLARTSKTPGRTQMINFFSLDAVSKLVDLPGYGYAKVPLIVKSRWMENVDQYLRDRDCLRGLVVVMDIRHPLKELDEKVIDWAVECQLPTHVLLTKSDKLKPAAARRVLKEVQAQLEVYGEYLTAQIFSSIDEVGLNIMREVLDQWFSPHDA
jgi:GTP-binding protein